MDDLRLLIDLHRGGRRQGPGGDAETELALVLAGIDRAAPLEIADIGCGTGASAILLAKLTKARITAVDFLPEFLDVLGERAAAEGVRERIETLACSMLELPFAEDSFDTIWSEGAVYNIGFEAGVRSWRRYLKPGGLLVVSEITWTTRSRPGELQAHWEAEYPEIGTASEKLAVLERRGYVPVGYFLLPRRCWLDEYYHPMRARFAGFLDRNGSSEAARAVVAAEEREMDLYDRFGDFYGYGFYVARKAEEPHPGASGSDQ